MSGPVGVASLRALTKQEIEERCIRAENTRQANALMTAGNLNAEHAREIVTNLHAMGWRGHHMSKHVKLGFRYSKWTLTDTDKYARLCCGGCEMTDTLMDPTDPRYLAAVRTAYDADAHRRAARAAREAASAIAAAAAASARLRR